jgi:hypothetical protein
MLGGNYPRYGWTVAHNYVPGNGMPDPFPVGAAFYEGAGAGQIPGLWIGGW